MNVEQVGLTLFITPPYGYIYFNLQERYFLPFLWLLNRLNWTCFLPDYWRNHNNHTVLKSKASSGWSDKCNYSLFTPLKRHGNKMQLQSTSLPQIIRAFYTVLRICVLPGSKCSSLQMSCICYNPMFVAPNILKAVWLVVFRYHCQVKMICQW